MTAARAIEIVGWALVGGSGGFPALMGASDLELQRLHRDDYINLDRRPGHLRGACTLRARGGRFFRRYSRRTKENAAFEAAEGPIQT